MPFTEDDICEALQTVIDPEVGLDIWTMGLVYAVDRTADGLNVTMTLTTRGCPMGEYITTETKAVLESLDGVGQAHIDLVFDPPWHPGMIDHSGQRRLQGSL